MIRKKDNLCILTLVLLVVFIYGFSIEGKFHIDDDQYILRNAEIHDLSVFLSTPPRLIKNRYLFNLSLAINYHLSKLNPWPYHLFNLLGHILVTIGLFHLAKYIFRHGRYRYKKISDPVDMAFITALFFGIHPLAGEPVLYVMARNSGWGAVFYVYGICLYWIVIEKIIKKNITFKNPLKLITFFLSCLIIFICASSFKESYLIFPASLLLITIYVIPVKKINIRNYYPVICILVFFFTISLFFIFRRFGIFHRYTIEKAYIYSQFSVIINMWLKLIIPFGLCIDHLPVYYTRFSGIVGVALLFHIVFIAYGSILFFKKNPIGFAILWSYIIIFPTNSFLYRPDILSERNFYLFVFGGGIIFAHSLNHLRVRFPGMKKVVYCVTALFILFFICIDGYRMYIFRDRIRLLERVVKLYPRHIRAHLNLGMEYENIGRDNKAFIEYKKVIISYNSGAGKNFLKRARDYWVSMAYNNMGALTGNSVSDNSKKRASEFFRKSLHTSPENLLAINNLANIHIEDKLYDEALELYEKALGVENSNKPVYIIKKIMLYNTMNDKKAIAKEIERLSLIPGISAGLLDDLNRLVNNNEKIEIGIFPEGTK